MYKLNKFGDNCLKTSGSLWQYFREDPNATLKNSESFKLKVKLTGKNPTDGNTKDAKIEVPLKYLYKCHLSILKLSQSYLVINLRYYQFDM